MLKRSLFSLSAALALPCILLTAFLFASFSPAMAQDSGTAQITGSINDTAHTPVGGAQVRLSGPVSQSTSTAANGSFAFRNLPAGIYHLDIARGGFNGAAQDDIVITSGGTANVGFTLQAASLTSVAEIGRVSASANGANRLNTSAAAIANIPASTFTQQGQLGLNQVLNEIPGLTIGVNGVDPGSRSDGASPLAAGIPSIRGGLPYETESLIDGHPISLGQYGYLNSSILSPYVLQNVEVVKGPGATSPSINYAVNGTINYRTLEPTLKREGSIDIGVDQFGGNFANYRLTGTLPDKHLSYAFDYATQGTQGPDRGFTAPAEVFGGPQPTTLNGVPILPTKGLTTGPGPYSPFLYNALYVTNSLLVCCLPSSQTFNQRNQLGKIRYAFTPSTTLTVTYLGSQTAGAMLGGYMFPYNYFYFKPTAGYTGSLPPGLATDTGSVPFLSGFWNGYMATTESNLYETEFHTPLGKTATLLLRQYSSTIQNYHGGPGESTPSNESFTASVYGDVYYASAPNTPVLFNGQTANIVADQYSEARSYDRLNGYSAEIDKQAGNALLSLSYDVEKTSTLATADNAGLNTVPVPGGSSQQFASIMARAQFALGQRVNGTLSDNFGSYTDTYSQNAGLSFLQSSHTYQAPRLSLTWRPNVNQSFRFAAGESIAPPYIALLNNNAAITYIAGASPAFSMTANSGDLLPETAFGINLGFDARLKSPYTVLSVDAYETTLHNQFLNSTTQNGTYTCPNASTSCLPGSVGPLYVTKSGNIGHSKYEGIELSLHHTPPVGLGYRIQGSLQRAYVYDLPAGFYNTATATNATNLGIIPYTNFAASGLSYNTISSVAVPYSTGYGEFNYRGRNGAYILAGVTYYGPNNSYSEPAFGVVTASYSQPVTRRMSLQLSVYNVTNAYHNIYYSNIGNGLGGSIYTPLINGKLGETPANVIGPSTARLTLHVAI